VTCPVLFLQNGLRVCAPLGPAAYEGIESVVNFNVVYDAEAGSWLLSQSPAEASLVLDGRRPAARALAAHLAATRVEAKVEDDFYAVQCGKLLMNLTNAVNALSGEYIAPMLMQAPYRLVLAASITEAQAVYAASGVTPKAAHPRDATLLRWFVALLRSPQFFFAATVGRKLKGRGAGHTSMAQDLMSHRVPTEIDFLNGEIVRLGRAHNVPTPVNERLIELVKQAEAANTGSPRINGEDLAKAVGLSLGGRGGRGAGAVVLVATLAAVAALAMRGPAAQS